MIKFLAGVFVGLLLGGVMLFIQTKDEFAQEAHRLESLLDAARTSIHEADH
jgi:hypothetical protein